MRAPDFWWQAPPSIPARLLAPVAALWGRAAELRMRQSGARASVPVICVGNPVAGGAGKTPAALEIARLLIAAQRRPVFLTRGYGGRLRGPVQVDPDRHDASDVGDEPLLLARVAPCVVAADRVKGAGLAARLGDVIVMDDGFQNPALEKDLSFLVADAESGIGNGLCIPAGPLRAPLAPQLARAGALVLVGEGQAGEALARTANLPVLRARLVPDAEAAARLKGRRVLAFAGIGRPAKFASTLKDLGADVVRLSEFPDHHRFTATEIRVLTEEARRQNLILVTTEKDRVRLGGKALTDLVKEVETVPVRLVFDEPEAVSAKLEGRFSGFGQKP